jgi:hypothetical protein
MNENETKNESLNHSDLAQNGETVPSPARSAPVMLDDVSISVDERRQYMARIPVEIDLHITTPEKKGIGRSIDVSVTGLLVHTLLELQWEERVLVTILHPEEDAHVCALVARVAEADDPNLGNKYGLRVLSDDAGIWQGVLRRLILSP